MAKRWKEDVPAIMGEIANFFETVEVWSAAGIKVPFSAFVSDKGWNFGTVMNALRLSLVGGSFGPDFFEICEIVGKAETVGRIRKAVATIKV